MKEGYKKTELGWIPEDWDVNILSDISEINPKKEILDNKQEVSFIAMDQISNSGRVLSTDIRKYGEVSKGYTAFRNNDVLLAKITPCFENGKKAVIKNLKNGIGFGSTEFHVLRSKDGKSIPEFIYYYISTHRFRQTAELNMTGSAGQKRVPTTFLNDNRLMVPPLKEQQKIAEILSTVDSQIDDTDKLIEKTKELKKGLMQRLLTKGMDHKEFKKTEIGEIPVEWEVKILNNITDVRDGTHDSPKYVDHGIPFITSKNLKEHRIDFSDINYISNEDHEKFSQRSNIDNGDILFGMIGTIGNPVIVKKEFEFSIKNVALIKFNDNSISNTFLLNILKSNLIEKQFEKLSNGGVQKFIALGMIRNLLIPVPSVKEQQEIANILSAVDIQIEECQNKKIKLEEIKKALMQQLLTGKIRVF